MRSLLVHVLQPKLADGLHSNVCPLDTPRTAVGVVASSASTTAVVAAVDDPWVMVEEADTVTPRSTQGYVHVCGKRVNDLAAPVRVAAVGSIK